MNIGKLLLTTLTLMVCSHSFGQKFTFIKDINPNTAGDSKPAFFINYDKDLIFAAQDAANSLEPYRTDGTTAGTGIIKQINSSGSALSAKAGVSGFVVMGSNLYFIADDGSGNGNQLWVTDNTSANTQKVATIGGSSNGIGGLTLFNGNLYFYANDGTHGMELWISDGTSSGTKILNDINSGSASSNPSYLTVVGKMLFFVANDGSTGNELWATDGTSNGTFQMADLASGATGSNPKNLTGFNGKCYFQANDGNVGAELYVSDGTQTGTKIVKDIYATGTSSSSPTNFFAEGTSKLFFTADDGTHGFELWATDGTKAGTAMVKDINSGKSASSPYNFAGYNGKVYFVCNDGSHGLELWVTDGTSSGTAMVKDLNPGTGSSSPSTLTNYAGCLYYIANDGTHGTQLAMTDGTDTGTHVYVNPKATKTNPMAAAAQLALYNGSLYFASGADSTGIELWSFFAPLRTGINAQEQSIISAKIYPNPLNGDQLNIRMDNSGEGTITIQLISMDGRILLDEKRENANNDLSINIPSSIHNGLYLLSLKSAIGTSVQKVMVER